MVRANQGDFIRDIHKDGQEGWRWGEEGEGRGRGRYQKPLNDGSIWSSGIYVGCGDGLAGDRSRGEGEGVGEGYNNSIGGCVESISSINLKDCLMR